MLRYAMSLPVATTISGIATLEHLRQNLAVARGFEPMTPARCKRCATMSRRRPPTGRFELYKVSLQFDNPQARLAHGFPIDPSRSRRSRPSSNWRRSRRRGRRESESIAMARRAEVPHPKQLSLLALRDEASDCKRCDLWKKGTQDRFFGEGPETARMVLVGEQPGDAEDVEGHPFVGPAGALLIARSMMPGIDRAITYVTNAVKHFKWGAARKAAHPRQTEPTEIAACRPWLDAEIATVKPQVIVCLGATASQASSVNRSRDEGSREADRVGAGPARQGDRDDSPVVDPPRADDDARHEAMRGFVADFEDRGEAPRSNARVNA